MSDRDPDWNHYRTFLAVLRSGSLSAAARDLGLTQPTAGRHIEALERSLGFELFTRSPQGLLPTGQALALKPYAETLASTAAALLRAASAESGRVAGTVRISASEVIGVEVLPPILARLQDAYPGLSLELSLSDDVEDLLRREADIAVRMTEPAQGALVARRIGTIAVGLHAHRRYLERHGTPETVAGLAGHRLVGFDRPTAFARATLTALHARAPDFPLSQMQHFAWRADSNLAQLAAIRAGAGIGFCQTPLASRDPALVRLLAGSLELPLPAWVVMHEDLKAAPRCRATFDALVHGLLDYVKGVSVAPEA